MDDLLSEDWKAPSKPAANPPSNPPRFVPSFDSIRPSPQLPSSGTASPQVQSRPSSTVNGTKPSKNDQFGNLLSLKSQKAGSNLSLLERQKQLLEETRKQQEQTSHLWDNLASGRGTPEINQARPVATLAQADEDDILAAFNKAATVDKASHFPPPSSEPLSGRSTPAVVQPAPSVNADIGRLNDDDDDPFGLGVPLQNTNGHAGASNTSWAEDDNILGELAKPVAERPARSNPVSTKPTLDETDVRTRRKPQEEPLNQELVELLEMGFPEDTAKIALAENGGDVQGAVGWLLQQAHEESRQKARGEQHTRRRSPQPDSRSPARRRPGEQDDMPTWMRQEGRSSSSARRQDNASLAGGEKEPAQIAQEFGTKLFKSANSLWKASQKQMAKTVAEFQHERDSSQPKWMSDASADSSRASSQRRDEKPVRRTPARTVDTTDEAAMLDAPREARPAKPPRPNASQLAHDSPARGRSPIEPLPNRASSQSTPMPQPLPQQDRRPISKVSRQDVDEQSAQAYVSPARRKRPTAKPDLNPEPEVDLFSSAPIPQSSQVSPATNVPSKAAPKTAPAPSTSRPTPAPAPVRAQAPPRSIPSVSPAALSTSAKHRKSGGEAFKRGDYAAAHESYTAALSPLPATHPIAIIVLSNRSLTALKTGDAKTAVADAERALGIIGVGQGIGETIDIGAGEGTKDMRDFYGKALMRKAEALEHLEKWSDASSVWRQAVSAGVGGAVSLRGRDRCEKAATPQRATTAPNATPRSAPVPHRAPPPAKGLGNSLHRPSLTTAASAQAVKKLRAANAAADRADDEKFALTDQVDARLTAWKGGKVDNLRALLQSLDGVLWEGAGWKKVGMSDLVMPNKVKIVYMKAIAKVHPDKIPQDATTEQRMVSGAVFSILNEAWDKFKKDNSL